MLKAIASARVHALEVRAEDADAERAGPDGAFRLAEEVGPQAIDAFGPERFFWGTDITRMPCSYRQCVTMFTEELPWLSGRDLELVMGRAVCAWIGWDFPFG